MNTDGLPDDPLATFEALRLPGWEWEVYEVEERGVTVAVGVDATGEPETEETDLFFGRVRSPNTYGRWEWGSFSQADLSRAAAYRTDEGDADVLAGTRGRRPMSWTCDYCDAEYDLASAPDSCRDHESTGFGAHNEVWFDFCSRACRALHRSEGDEDDVTEQAAVEAEAETEVEADDDEWIPPWEVRARRFGSAQSTLTWTEGDVPAWAVRSSGSAVRAEERREVAA